MISVSLSKFRPDLGKIWIWRQPLQSFVTWQYTNAQRVYYALTVGETIDPNQSRISQDWSFHPFLVSTGVRSGFRLALAYGPPVGITKLFNLHFGVYWYDSYYMWRFLKKSKCNFSNFANSFLFTFDPLTHVHEVQ